ncbi:hypothetical protein ASPZODRAFT_130293 [Penicilliopsis zonata CBS 506.65]|uniref:Major facilitator superfamily (MFS) profile domain-containing protein n=1 Tax=Penicilliopsis zonata CBS 506.65 TaxID=1073090 RepID=A0A1L9SMN4_9EURO|nr:hypothetical protein ASPZODRAFT_130293 [Penicilliopsis zonata CBS 506.65]OJJ48314.1 hypothetical protein ASPZODRAFT_130293 [Penicilliopsis zonata CBS 506.65]
MHTNSDTPSETTEIQPNTTSTNNIEATDGPDIEKNLLKPNADGGDGTLSGARLLLLSFALCFTILLIALNGSIVSTAVPKITSQFNSIDDIGWYGSAALLTNCALNPLTGKIYTFCPLKATFLVFQSIFMLGSLLSAVAVSSNMFIVGRAVQGMGGAGLLSGAFTIIAAAVPRDKKPLYVGIGIAISSIGSVIGPVVGGALTQHASWRWCFYINLPPGGLACLLLLLMRIPEQIEKKPVTQNFMPLLRELDLIGFALFAPACTMFLLALNWGGSTYPWKSATVIGLFCGSFVMACIFAGWQWHRGDRAMIPPIIIGNRLVAAGCLVAGFQMGALFMLSYYLPLWFQAVKGASPTMSGVRTLPSMISQAIGSVVAGKFVQVVKRCTPWALFGSALSAIGAGLMSTFYPWTGAGPWIGYQILTGAGRGSVMQMPLTAVQSFLPANQVAIATSSIFFTQYFGGTVFLSVAETIMDNSLPSALHKYAPNANVEAIVAAGATAFRTVTDKADLPGVLLAFNLAITRTFYLAAAGGCIAFVSSFGMGWQKIENSPKKQ